MMQILSKNHLAFLLFGVLVCLVLYTNALAGQRTHTVYFEEQENELHVYRIIGSNPGKTLLIIGGIQGDEPSGFLAADAYVDFSLKTGSLILVPRANFPSILKRERQINQDMNRKFSDDRHFNYETRVVNVLKRLIGESDCFLNLHEGSGVYSPVWESETKNPDRYGQSIIADNSVLDPARNGTSVDLAAMARKVIERINQNIDDPFYHFHFNNHRTSHVATRHKEQRRSATYYATDICRIPAFGIESAKSLPLEQKVRQQMDAINGFMAILDIIPETPGINLEKPRMQYMILSVNDAIPVVVGPMQRLKMQKGDTVQVMDIVANYERGLSVDVLGVGSRFNDMKKKLVIHESTRIEVKKDFYACGSVFLDIDDPLTAVPVRMDVKKTGTAETKTESAKKDIQYTLTINGSRVIADNYSRITLTEGDILVIEDIVNTPQDPSGYVVNFKGFVGNKSFNSGEDRGYPIDIGKKGVLMPRYSRDKKGRHYHVLTTLEGKEVGKLYIDTQL
ncbi:MAG: M14/M99 family metallopeptidase [Desulfotignum sp.]|nr:M14/M99 family metallopeptidase [Desulfobacteraceae bacterium]